MILKSKNITLRPLQESDFDKYFKWHSDKEIRFQTLMHPYPVTEKLEKDWLEKVMSDFSNKRYVFSIIHNTDKNLIGYFQLTEVNFINRNASLGIVIGEKEYQGKGLGEEIMQLGINYAFKSLNINKIRLSVISDNQRALSLYKKLGFKEEGLLKFVNGLTTFKEVFREFYN